MAILKLMTRLRILIVDDHEVVRLGLKSLLERHSGFEVVAEASSGEEAIEMALAHQPDVTLMDIRLPGKSGIEACEEITRQLPNTKVVMLTSYAEDEMLFSAIRAGAAGYVLKQIGSDDLVKAIKAAARGEATLDTALTQRVFAELRKSILEQESSAFAELSRQELRVLALVTGGQSNRQIAGALFLGEGTVRNYVSSILSKLHVSNRAEAAAYAVKHRIDDFLNNK